MFFLLLDRGYHLRLGFGFVGSHPTAAAMCHILTRPVTQVLQFIKLSLKEMKTSAAGSQGVLVECGYYSYLGGDRLQVKGE